jgi:uncharacterized RDD family membrane protein YckC
MSSTEPPAGSTPPPGEPTPPPAPAAATPPPPNPGTVPPPPPAGAAAPMAGPAVGVGQPGSLVDRFLARLIDGIIIGIVYVIIYAVLLSAVDYFLAVFLSGVVAAVLYIGYFAYMESNRGQTLGKQIMKLRTFGPDGASNPTMEQAVRRNIWYAFDIVPFIGPLAVLASVILIAIGINGDPRRQHWFDKFAGGTTVIKVG